MPHPRANPLVGITLDAEQLPTRLRLTVSHAHARCIAQAGGLPVMLGPIPELAHRYAALCDAFILTGGDDPRTEPFGEPTHPKATPVLESRQEFETTLLRVLADQYPHKPVLGVCLGMQMMALVAGGRLNQHLPDTLENAAHHWDTTHPITSTHVDTPGSFDLLASLSESSRVHSRHRQAVDEPGSLTVLALADDGIIEAVADPSRNFYLGVQWHPERTEDPALGLALFRQAVVRAGRDD